MPRVLAIGLLFAYPLGSDLGGIPSPQLDVQFRQQALEPACVSTGFHSQTNASSLSGKLAVKLLRRLGMLQPFSVEAVGA